MKLQRLLSMLFDLLEHRRLTARFFTEKYNVSARTVYRDLDELARAVPLTVSRGREGGVILSSEYTLPVDFLTKTEYEATVYALEYAYSQTANARFLEARQKISRSQQSTEADILA